MKMRCMICVFWLVLVALAAAQEARPSVERLRTGDTAARTEAIATLAREGTLEDARALLPLLAADEDLLSQSAWRALEGLSRRLSGNGPAAEKLATELLSHLPSKWLPAESQRNLTRLCGLLARSGGTVKKLAELLGDETLFEAALFALEGSRHPASFHQLIAWHGRVPSAQRQAIVQSLTRLGFPGTEAFLRGVHARAATRAETRTALRAIADLGAPQSADFLLQLGRPDLLARWSQRCLSRARAAEAAALAGLHAVLGSEDEAARMSAVTTLLREQRRPSPLVHDQRLDQRALGDDSPAVRAAARRVLGATDDPAEFARWHASCHAVEPRVQAECLRLMVSFLQRNEGRLGEKLSEALHQDLDELLSKLAKGGEQPARGVALRMLGDRPLAFARPVLQDALAQPTVAADAAAALLAQARRLTGDEKTRETARQLLHTGFAAAREEEGLLLGYLGALASCASPDTLELVEPFTGRSGIAQDVAAVQLQAARGLAKTDPETAIEVLQGRVLEHASSRGTRRSSYRLLGELGVDLSGVAGEKGFIIKWLIMGGLPRIREEQLAELPFGEGPTRAGTVTMAGRVHTWSEHVGNDPEGEIDLRFLTPNEQCHAYAWCELVVPAATELSFGVGSDDGVAVWVNGECVHRNWTSRGVTIDQDRFSAKLRKGPNQILVKIVQGGGGFGFCFRPLGEDGPIDVRGMARLPR